MCHVMMGGAIVVHGISVSSRHSGKGGKVEFWECEGACVWQCKAQIPRGQCPLPPQTKPCGILLKTGIQWGRGKHILYV